MKVREEMPHKSIYILNIYSLFKEIPYTSGNCSNGYGKLS